MRRAARIDATASDLVKHAKKLGAKWYPIGGIIDGLLLYRGRHHMVDFKSKGGRLTENQARMVAEGWPLRFLHTPEDVEDLLLAKDERL